MHTLSEERSLYDGNSTLQHPYPDTGNPSIYPSILSAVGVSVDPFVRRGIRAVWVGSSMVMGSREHICACLLRCRAAAVGGSQGRLSRGRKTATASRTEQKLVCTRRASALPVPPLPTSSSVQPCFFRFCPVYPHPLWSASGPFSTLQPQ